MKVFLMYRDRDFDLSSDSRTTERRGRVVGANGEVASSCTLQAGLPTNAAELTQDLELETLLRAMSGDDKFLLKVATQAVLSSMSDPEAILYRQHILADCLDKPEIVRGMYGIAVEAIEREKKFWGWMSIRYPEGTLHHCVGLLKMFVDLLKRLRRTADDHSSSFRSEGFRRLFDMFAHEFGDEYIGTVEDHLQRLEFRKGILMSAELGKGSNGINYVLRKPWETRQGLVQRVQGWLEQLTGRSDSAYVYEVADRDEGGLRALSELRGQGIGHIAAALAESTDHILSFFNMLRTELGFYISCLNLREQLARKGEPLCLPEPATPGNLKLSARGLYDVCLSLSLDGRVVGNDVAGDQKALVMVTGANRGGKSTFLRGLGLAQLMMQCGMFVPAQSFRANVAQGIFTHFKREEDATMRSGKLDEELRRMNTIVDNVTPGSVVLLNESFASTNEREGSQIARQIVHALLQSGVKVFYVTHMFDLAQSFYRARMDGALFLRAERLEDGRRTFRLNEGEPLPTSYGADLYRRIFAPSPADAPPSVEHRVQ